MTLSGGEYSRNRHDLAPRATDVMSGSSTARTGDLVSGGVTVDFTRGPDKPILPRTATTAKDDQISQERTREGAEGHTAKRSKKAGEDRDPKKPKKPVGKPQPAEVELLVTDALPALLHVSLVLWPPVKALQMMHISCQRFRA